jgi:hypothetical protein
MAHQTIAPSAPARSTFQPYVAPSQSVAEFTARAIVLGALFGLLFGASTVYLGLRAGLTVSASIPIAVLAISVLKRLGGSTILENNIVQTIGSAGESVAGGVVFTIPALIFLVPNGPSYFNYVQITLLALAGGILGVLMMVPLRRALIVKEHGVLPYPEGTACAEVLVAGERGGKLAALVFGGLGIGALWKALSWIFNLFRTEIGHSMARTSQFPNATLNVDISPEYLGVGYVIGPRIAGTMFAGGVLSWLVLLPLLSIVGAAIAEPFPPIHPNFANNPATGRPFLISEMAPGQLWSAYIRYIGAGAVLASGLITLARTIPTIVASARGSFRDLGAAAGAAGAQLRTERDIPMSMVLGGSVLLGLFLVVTPGLPTQGNVLAALLDDRDAHPHLPPVRRHRLDGRHLRPDRADGRRDRLYRGGKCGGDIAGSQNRLHRRRDPNLPADRPDHRRARLGLRDRHDDALPAPGIRDRVAGHRGTAGHADGHHHQRPAQPEPALGSRARRYLRLHHARVVRHPFTVLRRRFLSANRDHCADFRWWTGALLG